ncbi:hypothetical protein LAJ19_20970 (plasmid) [Deinococcus taeanensis]|uniref:hypothetical protein n=1 Tax=Deinococcus taeanensis TaxID=2737050 RepID=UPI001CDD2C8A|nr:hypothetical protein [Deinococcus taeanensis]UBV45270.1 hypothetical protein LAJ19_20970 [Deinococcus taeanensis]
MEETCTRRIEIRMVRTEQKRYEKGTVVRTPGPDPLRIGALMHADLTRAAQARYGEDTEVTFQIGAAPDIRLHGTFPDKAPVVRAWMQGVMTEVLENLSDVE